MISDIYKPKNKVRFVTAASLFDGHDASINIMRRILQSSGAEVIHLGHNRSVDEVVNCAIQEDVQAIAKPVLRHRIILSPEKEMEGVTEAEVIKQIIQGMEVPR